MNMKHTNNISIIGSCISRDIFSFNGDAGYNIKRFVQSISPISAQTGGVNEDYKTLSLAIESKYKIPFFYCRNFALDLTGRTFDYLFEEPVDYLVVDMACCRYDIWETEDGDIISKVDGYYHDEIVDEIFEKYDKSQSRKLINNDEKILCLLKKRVPQYFQKILEKIHVSKIILVETRAMTFYLQERQQIAEFSPAISDSWNKRIQCGFEIALKYLKGCHVIYFPQNMVGDAKHKWGLSRLHYVKEFYEYAFQAINIIGENRSSTDERKALSTLYNKVNKDYYEFFSLSLYKTLKMKRIVESEDERLWKYNDYFQKILLNYEKLQRVIDFMLKEKYSCAFYGLTQISIFYINYFKKYDIVVDYVVENRKEPMWRGISCLSREIKEYPPTDIIIIADVINMEKINLKD